MAEVRQARAPTSQRAARLVDGTQSLRRAVSVLRILAENNQEGLPLTDAVKQSGLNKATTHRILSALVAEGLAAQDDRTRKYYLGVELVALGVAARSRYGIAQMARPNVVRLAEELGDTAYLSVRSGNDAVCLLREVGSFPIKTLTFPPGARTPLGLGSGSLALLAFEPDETRTKLIQHAAQRLGQGAQKISQSELLDNIKKTRKTGFACLGDRIVPGMRAIAIAVRNPDGTVAAALSVASIQPRLEGKRQQEVMRLLKRECAELEEKLRISQSGIEI